MEMKHYKDENGNLFGYFADGSQDHLIGDKKKITDKQLEKLVEQNRQKELSKLSYNKKRSLEYPSIGDQLDDLFKAGAFSKEMAAKIQAIKEKYPKEWYDI